MTENNISRRRFIRESATGLAATSAMSLLAGCQQVTGPIQTMPTRTLGKTGLNVSMLSFGGGSQFLKNKPGEWEPLLEHAVRAGINLFDTCCDYKWQSDKTGEQRYGDILPGYRDKIIICTKCNGRQTDIAKREIEQSLKDLRTDTLDILLIHNINDEDNVADIEKGVYKLLTDYKQQGIARFIGFSSMSSARKSKEFLEALDVDVVLLAISPTRYGGYTDLALPVAREKNVGVLAMKVMRDVVNKHASPRELIQYALDQQGVASALIGHYGMDILKQNIDLVRQYPAHAHIADTGSLETRLAHLAGPHALCWARPDYVDGMRC